MSRRRVVALFRRIVEEIRRDRPSMALLFIAPIVLTGLVTFILREGETPVVHAAIVNEAGAPGSAVASALGSTLAAQGGSAIELADEAAARAALESGSVSVAIVLPVGAASGGSPAITVLTSGLDPSADAAQLGALQKAILATVGSVGGTRLPTIDHRTIYGASATDPMTNYAPAIVGFFAYFFVYLLTGVSFLRERTGGTLERLMATPVARGEIVIGYTLGFGLFATVQVAVLLAWVLGAVTVPSVGPVPSFSLGLGVPIAGSPLLAFLVVVLLAFGAVNLGILCSTFARTELQIIQFIPLVISPQFLLSGVLFPVSSLPAVVQPLAPLMPLTYAVNGLRQVFVRGADLGVADLQLDLVALGLIAVLFAVVAALTIRREIV